MNCAMKLLLLGGVGFSVYVVGAASSLIPLYFAMNQ